MADYDWPTDLVPFQQTFYLQPQTVRSESPFTRQQKVYALTAPRWVCRMSFRGGYDGTSGMAAYGPRLDALIAKLEGGTHRIAIWDFRREGSAQSFSNAAIASGATQVTLLSTSTGLSVGDYIGGDGRPHIVTDAEDTGADILVTVKPHFQSAVSEGEATYERVPGYFRLISDDAGMNATEVGGATIYNLDFYEDPGPSTDILYDEETVTYSG